MLFPGSLAGASLKRADVADGGGGERPLPRLFGRGLIEAIARCASTAKAGTLPRLFGRGLIEARLPPGGQGTRGGLFPGSLAGASLKLTYSRNKNNKALFSSPALWPGPH